MKKIIPFLLLLCALVSYKVSGQATCDGDNITILTGLASGTETIHASSTIVTQSGTSIVITNGATANYKAGTSITLNPGFKVEFGAEFTASIEACTLAQKPFVTKWVTTENNETITIPTTGTDYDYEVDWNYNGVTFNAGSTNIQGDAVHTYNAPGTYTIAIRGDFPRIYFNNSGDKDKIVSIEQWGSIVWSSMNRAFYGCSMLQVQDSLTAGAPDLTMLTDMSGMFGDCDKLNQDLDNWDVSNVINMSGMFQSTNGFNGDISNWNTSNVENMSTMFNGAKVFNRDLFWDVKKVTNMASMFHLANLFDGNITNWETLNVEYMSAMFCSSSFSKDISSWDVSSVTNMSSMFSSASSFNYSLGNWDVSNVTDMTAMLDQSGLNRDNYESTLIGWVDLHATKPLQQSVILGNAGMTYCTAEAITARNFLRDPNGLNWGIYYDVPTCIRSGNPRFVMDNLNTISIYPNPVKNFLNIRTDIGILKRATIKILDISGRIVRHLKGKDKIDVSVLRGGIYLLEVTTADRKEVIRFVKE